MTSDSPTSGATGPRSPPRTSTASRRVACATRTSTRPRCALRRGPSLLTGRNHHAVGMGSLANYDLGFDGYRGVDLHGRPHCCPRSSAKPAGTALPSASGTSPRCTTRARPGPFYQWPTQRGFDRFYGFMDGAMNHWEPFLTEDNHHVATPDTPGYHLTTDLDGPGDPVRERPAIRRPRASRSSSISPSAPATPRTTCPKDDDRRLRAGVREGLGRNTRPTDSQRQKAMGLVPPDTELPPRNPGVPVVGRPLRRGATTVRAVPGGVRGHGHPHRPGDRTV